MAHRTLAGLKCHKDRALFIEISSKSGAEYSNELPGMRKAFAEVPTNSAILDGELCLMDPRGGAYFYLLMHQMCVIWTKPATDSDAIRPPVLTEVGHPIWRKPATHSD